MKTVPGKTYPTPPEHYDGEPSIPRRTPAGQAQSDAAVAAGIARIKAIQQKVNPPAAPVRKPPAG